MQPSGAAERWVVASGNAGKLAEFARLLAPLRVQPVAQSEFGIEPVAETGLTFVENALLKARHACRQSDLPAIADDSGLCVDALDGAPGLYSARYAGAGASDAQNNALLLERLVKLQPPARRAAFVCTIVALRHADDPDPLIATGRWGGQILSAPRGANGFGYDPLFVGDGQQHTAAEMSAEAKSALSHRGQAVRALLDQWHARAGDGA